MSRLVDWWVVLFLVFCLVLLLVLLWALEKSPQFNLCPSPPQEKKGEKEPCFDMSHVRC